MECLSYETGGMQREPRDDLAGGKQREHGPSVGGQGARVDHLKTVAAAGPGWQDQICPHTRDPGGEVW